MLSPYQTIQSLKTLYSLNVPPNSEIGLILMNMLRHEINNLSMDQILFLDFLLNRVEVCSQLQKGVIASLPFVFEHQLHKPLDDKQMNGVKLLEFVAKHPTLAEKNENLEKICNLISEQIESLTTNDAIVIVHDLCAINRFNLKIVDTLYQTALNHVINQVREIEINKLLPLTKHVMRAPNSEIPHIRKLIHQQLNNCSGKVIEEKLDIDSAILLQRIMKNIVSFFYGIINLIHCNKASYFVCLSSELQKRSTSGLYWQHFIRQRRLLSNNGFKAFIYDHSSICQ